MTNLICTLATLAATMPLGDAPTTKPAVPLSALGWLFMLSSTISMTVLTLWCFARVLSDHAAESEKR